jgi:hypothetical protein
MRRSTWRALACLLPILVVVGLVPAPAASAQQAEIVPAEAPPRVQLRFDPDEKPAPPIPRAVPAETASQGRAALSVDAGVSVIYDPAFPFPAAAKTAFDYAASIVGDLIDSPVEIVVLAAWKNLGSGSLLGSAGPGLFFPSQPGLPELPEPNTSYPVGLVNALRGSDLCPAVNTPSHCQIPDGPLVHWDIDAEFNSAFSNWHFGTDAAPGSKIDFVSVVLHELVHGLGYVAGFQYNTSTGAGSYGSSPPVYARRVVNDAGQSLTNTALFPNPSVALGNQLKAGTGKIRWSGTNGVAGAGGTQPILYSPTTFSAGSSISHLDEGTYPSGNPNALMTPTIGTGQAVHDPGPISRGMLTDMGWTVVSGTPATVPDAPTNVTVAPSGTTVSVAFTPGSNGGSPVTEFVAWCTSTDGGVGRAAVGGASPIVVKSLTGGTTYTCRVRANNAVGMGPFSTASSPFFVS